VSEHIYISDHQNLLQNPHPNITIVFSDNAVHLRICNLPLTPENLKNKVNCMFACLFVYLYVIWVLNEVKYMVRQFNSWNGPVKAKFAYLWEMWTGFVWLLIGRCGKLF
jgi:hypothetical protein